MKTDNFLRRFDGKIIQDDGSVTSKEFHSFARCFKNYLKRQLPEVEILNYHAGHYDVSAFLKFPSGNIIYISYNVPRGNTYGIDVNRRDAHGGVLYRTAKDDLDYHGGSNNFTSLREITGIRRLDRK